MDGYIAVADKRALAHIAHKDVPEERRLILDLPPAPFYGNVKKSRILLLNGNPGFNESADYTDDANPAFLRETAACLSQTDAARMFSVCEEFSQTSHYKWWYQHLLPNVDADMRLRVFGADENARAFFEKNISVVEYLGYHSKSTPWVYGKTVLPSQEYGFQLVREAIKDGKVILVMRSKKLWEEAVPELKVYPCLHLRNTQNATISEYNVISQDGRKWSEILRSLL